MSTQVIPENNAWFTVDEERAIVDKLSQIGSITPEELRMVVYAITDARWTSDPLPYEASLTDELDLSKLLDRIQKSQVMDPRSFEDLSQVISPLWYRCARFQSRSPSRQELEYWFSDRRNPNPEFNMEAKKALISELCETHVIEYQEERRYAIELVTGACAHCDGPLGQALDLELHAALLQKAQQSSTLSTETKEKFVRLLNAYTEGATREQEWLQNNIERAEAHIERVKCQKLARRASAKM